MMAVFGKVLFHAFFFCLVVCNGNAVIALGIN